MTEYVIAIYLVVAGVQSEEPLDFSPLGGFADKQSCETMLAHSNISWRRGIADVVIWVCEQRPVPGQ